jgi:hypothetical protein
MERLTTGSVNILITEYVPFADRSELKLQPKTERLFFYLWRFIITLVVSVRNKENMQDSQHYALGKLGSRFGHKHLRAPQILNS